MVHGRIETTPAEQLVGLRETRDRYAALADQLQKSTDPLLDPEKKLAEERNARRIVNAYEKSIANSIARMSALGQTHHVTRQSLGARTWLAIFIVISAIEGALLLTYFRPAIFQIRLAGPQSPLHRLDRVASLPATIAPKPVTQSEAPPPIVIAPKSIAPQEASPPFANAAKPGAQQKARPPGRQVLYRPYLAQSSRVAVAPQPSAQPAAPSPIASAPLPSAQPAAPSPIAIAPQPSAQPQAPPSIAIVPKPSNQPVALPSGAGAPQPGAQPVAPTSGVTAPQPSTQPVAPPSGAAGLPPGTQPAPPAPTTTFVFLPAPPLAAAAIQPSTRLEPIAQTHSLPPYPTDARRLGEEGTTQMRVVISIQGAATDCEIVKSSGSERLDATACTYVQGHWRWKPPTRNGQPITANSTVNVVWNLKSAQ